MRFLARVSLLSAAIGALATPVNAHAFGQRYDLPLPLGYWLLGAGAAVAVSFVVNARILGAAAPTAAPSIPIIRRARWPRRLRFSTHLIAVALFALLIVAGFVGPQDEPQDNMLPVAVWVLWWVGMTFVVALAGDVWRTLNPLRIIPTWSAAVADRLGARPSRPPYRLPAALGMWPAVFLFVCFAWSELIWTSNGVPVKLASAILLYSALTFAAMALFGIDTWLQRGETFSRYFALIGRFAPFDLLAMRRRRYAGRAFTTPAKDASEAVFVLAVLATVSFDGLKETPFWADLAGAVMDGLYRAGVVSAIGTVNAETLVKTLGLIGMPLIMLAAYLATCLLMARLVATRGTSVDVRTIALQFAPSLVPIAIGYHVAHYFSYLLIQGQWIVPAASDPFGLGWDLFHTRGYEPDIAIIGAAAVWWTAVLAIVAGHVAAVVVAHAMALEKFQEARVALISQYPLLVLMVGYTMLSLWILAQPIMMH